MMLLTTLVVDFGTLESAVDFGMFALVVEFETFPLDVAAVELGFAA